MQWLNDSMNEPLRLITDNGETIGQFYNSWDKKYHLAKYIPHEVPPYKYLCGLTGNLSLSRSEYDRNKCEKCWSIVHDMQQHQSNNKHAADHARPGSGRNAR